MIFNNPDFTVQEKIELLERSILVHSYIYYELNENVLADYKYDHNTRQLLALKRDYPDVFKKSRYYRYFDNFESGTGFDLVSRIKKDGEGLYFRIARDAYLAVRYKNETEGI